MKRVNFPTLVLHVLFFFFPIVINGQERKGELITADNKPFVTDLHLKKKEKVGVFMYGHIIVKDCRPDNSKMGYVQLDAKAKPQKIVLPKEGETYLNEILNEAIHPLQGFDTLIIILNEIWFNETRTAANAVHKHLFGAEKLVSSCYINASFFVQKGEKFIPIGSFDSVTTKKGEWLPNNCSKLLERSVLNLLLAADKLWSHITSIEAVYTTTQLDSLVKNRFNYPIVKVDKPAKGIYFTYNDFLNNTPTPIDFTVLSDNKRTIKYEGMSSKDSSWGYSDGENIYMHLGKGFYLLNKAQNTYEVVGPATVEILNTFLDKTIKIAGGYATGTLISPVPSIDRLLYVDPMPYFEPPKYSIEYYKFFRLNMKNGMLN